MKKTLQLCGLDCANCAAELEEQIAAVDGVTSSTVTFVTQKLTLEYENEEALSKAIDVANNFEEVKVLEKEEASMSESKTAKVIKIQNLHCAACAMELQEDIQKIEGVKDVSVDFISQSITVDVAEENVLRKVIKTANHFEKVKVIDEESVLPKKESHLKEILQLVIAAVLFAVGLVLEHTLGKSNKAAEIVSYVVYGLAYLTVGYPVLISTVKNVSKGKIFDENFLMTIASVGAMALMQFAEAVEVMLLYQLGELLQSIAVGSSRRSITALMDLRSETATLLKDGEQITVKPEELKIGDIVLVKAGEKVPVDGVVLEGESALDVKSLTGESALKEVKAGDEVLSGSINAGANIKLKAIREYTDSAVAKILDLVENSASKKAEPEKFITKFAKYYTPIVCILALIIAVGVPVAIGLASGGYPFADWIYRALTLLVISCPCALIISVPLTYFGGIGAAARYGILVKGATYLDQAAKVKVAAFDKTGTLTEGDFFITNVFGAEETLSVAAAAERASSHPLARAFADVKTPYEA
ncbi:MAG: HAD-IC family P-type ATPase, partial [Clostridia bacterium]|nr:HAD-IC family P-type ATPase [Clostridia bacterium]